jgi:hexosaminidase
MMLKFSLMSALTFCATQVFALVIIPQPKAMTYVPGPAFSIDKNSALISCDAFTNEAQLARQELSAATGYTFDKNEATCSTLIAFHQDSEIAKEGYRLLISPKTARIYASDGAGAFYGYQTLRQLFPEEIYSKTVVTDVDWITPCAIIDDEPRLQWRGLHFDDSRHFMGPAAFKQMIDAMAIHKLNTLHWHLTDDQGWRIEIKAYPELISKGTVRDHSPKPWDRFIPDGKPYGENCYYTQEEIKELVAYAAARHINVVPEIEMPGHAMALLCAYPELGCTGGPYEMRWEWGVEPDILCAGNDKVFTVMETILDEVLALFPSYYIHCGGDEAPKDRWKACPKCQKRIADEKLRNEYHLQSWFIQHFANYLESKGRHLIGWDEILEGGLAKGAAVMSWRGAQGGIKAAMMGHNVVMSPNSHLYLDYCQGLPTDPYEYNCGYLPLERVYSFNPTDGIPETMASYVIGVQGNLWSEYMFDPADQQYKAWPRACALAEIGWTPQEKRQWPDFFGRAKSAEKRLRLIGINCAPVIAPLSEQETQRYEVKKIHEGRRKRMQAEAEAFQNK